MTKLEGFKKKIGEKNIDAVIIFDELNIHYLSGFSYTDGFLLISQNESLLVTDFRYYDAAVEKADKAFSVVMPKDRFETINAFILNNGVKTVGFEGKFVSYSRYKAYTEKFSDVEFVDIGNIIDEMRMIKTQDEIDKMQRAQDIADAAYANLLKIIKPDMTEIEVAAEIEYSMRTLGAEGPAFDTIAVSGDASSIPHGTPRNVKLKSGFLTMDFGAKYQGYLSDMTRTIVIGKADEDMKKLYNTVLKAQLAALDFIKEGVDASMADKVARDIIDSYPEFKGTFGHSLGHSIGLFVHEMPSLSPKSVGVKLCAGQVTSVEPGIYLSGKYGCRIEDLVVVLKDGVHNFTHSPKELIEIY